MNDAKFRRDHRQALVDDRVSGSSQLARQALESLAEYAGSCAGSDITAVRARSLAFAEELQYARPSMAPVYNLVQRWSDRVERLHGDDLAMFRRDAAEAAEALCDASISALGEAANHATTLLDENSVVVTHSYSSTVQEVFKQLKSRRQHPVRVIISESRPGMEGRDEARYLAGIGAQVTFITDAELGLFTGKATLALVGADAVLADGSVVNKVGTYLLALAARDHGIPFYICCESFKHVPFHAGGFELDEMSPGELDPPRHTNITARNVFFDITPARLITGWITETGVHADTR